MTTTTTANDRHAAEARVRAILATRSLGLRLDANGRIWSIDKHGAAFIRFADAVAAELVDPADGEAGTGWLCDAAAWTTFPTRTIEVLVDSEDADDIGLAWRDGTDFGPYGAPVADADAALDALGDLFDAAEEAGLLVEWRDRANSGGRLVITGPVIHPILAEAR